MEKKGLCSICVNDKECTFPRKFPVWQCEEFQNYEPKPAIAREVKRDKIEFDEEPRVYE